MAFPFSDTFRFRNGTPVDAELLTDLGWVTFDETFAAYNKPEDMAAFRPTMYSAELQAAELADPETEFIIAEVEGKAVAYIKLTAGNAPETITAKNPLQISRLYLLQQWTGKGLGDMLMQLSLNIAQQHNHDVVWLTVWEHNTRAYRFYQKYGFREVGELEFILGQDVQRDLYMQREIYK
ncbi:GNAT family N-acetyltransferase [Pontibacter silvestris]|uniref:GNAT family N-acetyltransferase n=1 Tax=Pontibacter silvestris TaxID=2305183 RepID=A0ABW4X4U3_9BACT|nr:GNAT family N-acetyltransferase [Pontibacter silvestris]MCC9137030.1 GNAT family N-acetyltransferase [Pontibacter silvestris]